MPTLKIGRKEIGYELRRSATSAERRIVVTPDHVEVLALASDDQEALDAFLQRKREWLFNTVREMERITAGRHSVPRLSTGSKIPFRGRKMSLVVRRTDAERMSITFRNRFIVDLPHWAEEDTDHLVASELKHWLKQRARREVRKTAADYAARFGLAPRSVRVADFGKGWGSCGSQGNILINWHLIFAPPSVLDYVVAHELAHLRVRSHASEFWQLLASINPAYREAKAWLDANQFILGDSFLRNG